MDNHLATTIRLKRPLGPFHLDVVLDSDADRIGIMGPSGSGKSTLMRILAGVDTRSRGLVRIGRQVLQDTVAETFKPAWERRTGWLPQDSLVFPHLSVRDNLLYAAPNEARVTAVAAALEIDDLLKRSSARLSGGEAQRVALGRALLSDAVRFLLDEPFSALDDALQSRIVAALDEELGSRPAVVVSHDRGLLESLGAELWTMDRGRVTPL